MQLAPPTTPQAQDKQVPVTRTSEKKKTQPAKGGAWIGGVWSGHFGHSGPEFPVTSLVCLLEAEILWNFRPWNSKFSAWSLANLSTTIPSTPHIACLEMQIFVSSCQILLRLSQPDFISLVQFCRGESAQKKTSKRIPGKIFPTSAAKLPTHFCRVAAPEICFAGVPVTVALLGQTASCGWSWQTPRGKWKISKRQSWKSETAPKSICLSRLVPQTASATYGACGNSCLVSKNLVMLFLDTSIFGLRLSCGNVPFVPWTFCPTWVDLHRDPVQTSRISLALAPKLSPGHFWGILTKKILCVCVLLIGSLFSPQNTIGIAPSVWSHKDSSGVPKQGAPAGKQQENERGWKEQDQVITVTKVTYAWLTSNHKFWRVTLESLWASVHWSRPDNLWYRRSPKGDCPQTGFWVWKGRNVLRPQCLHGCPPAGAGTVYRSRSPELHSLCRDSIPSTLCVSTLRSR